MAEVISYKEETIKKINSNVVLLNKYVQRFMYDIQIEGLEKHSIERVEQLHGSIRECLDKIKIIWTMYLD